MFGAHPDDVEWGIGGIALLLKKQGISFAVVDLTEGEMGSRGTREERQEEAEEARAFMGAAARVNLQMPDTALVDTPENRQQVAGVIRQFRPSLVLAPYWEDRHPDHAAAGTIVRNSSLYSTLKKLESPLPPHKPVAFLYYPLHQFHQPSFVIDTSDVFAGKLEALRLHRSQFAKTAEEFGVLPQGLGDYLFGLESRDRYLGSLVGVRHGEGLVTDRPLKLDGVNQLLRFTERSQSTP
jgi:N-acetylglucosamine malate deacetylase 1